MKRGQPPRRRTPLRSLARLQRRTPLQSRVRGRDHAERPLAAWCEIAKPGVCTGRAVHRHHTRLQSQGGRGGPTLDVCGACHDFAHHHRAEARAHGWIIDRQAS